MKTRVIQTKFWKDNYIASLPRLARYLFLYLISNEAIGLTGIYELSIRCISFDTDMTNEEIYDCLKLIEDKIIYKDGYVIIKNAIKYNNYKTSPKVNQAYIKELKSLPESILSTLYDSGLIPVSDLSDTAHKTKTIKHKPKTIKQNTKKEGGVGGEEVKTLKVAKSKLQENLDWIADEANRTKIKLKFPYITSLSWSTEFEKMDNFLTNKKKKGFDDVEKFATNWINNSFNYEKLPPHEKNCEKNSEFDFFNDVQKFNEKKSIEWIRSNISGLVWKENLKRYERTNRIYDPIKKIYTQQAASP